MSLVNGIANMTGIQLHMRRGADAQSYAAQFLSRRGVDHPEVICGHFVNRMRSETGQLQLKIRILKHSRINGRHWTEIHYGKDLEIAHGTSWHEKSADLPITSCLVSEGERAVIPHLPRGAKEGAESSPREGASNTDALNSNFRKFSLAELDAL